MALAGEAESKAGEYQEENNSTQNVQCSIPLLLHLPPTGWSKPFHARGLLGYFQTPPASQGPKHNAHAILVLTATSPPRPQNAKCAGELRVPWLSSPVVEGLQSNRG